MPQTHTQQVAKPETRAVARSRVATDNRRRRVSIFVAVCALAVVAIVIEVVQARRHTTPFPATAVASRPLVPGKDLEGSPFLLFRNTALDRSFGTLAVASPSRPTEPRAVSNLKCDRVDFAGGRGICLVLGFGVFDPTHAVVFDSNLRTLHSVTLAGYPSRARVSANGRFGATTTFVSGHSYAAVGFAVETFIIDLQSGEKLFDLEKLRVTRDGQVIQSPDFNFWGVTFADDNRTFYATLGTGGRTFLIKGDMTTRDATVLRADVECPSLSPDGSRIAFKSRNAGAVVTWQLSVLDLATLKDHPVAETRNVDDQAAWLDNDTLMFGLPDFHPGEEDAVNAATPGLPATITGSSITTDTWTVRADGSGVPRKLLAGAWSAVIAPATGSR